MNEPDYITPESTDLERVTAHGKLRVAIEFKNIER